MNDTTKIEWCDATVNVWIGCTKVSPGCDHCYAEKLARRFGVKWGPRAARRQTANWHASLERLHRKALRTRVRIRVFINSLADWADNAVPQQLRDKLWGAVLQFPHLDFILVTKRIGNAKAMLPAPWVKDGLPPNVWLLISVCTREEALREIPKLLAIPAAVRGISAEPLLEHLGDISQWLGRDAITWVIAGGESGHCARPMNPWWATGLRDQCIRAGVAFFFKQMGEWSDRFTAEQNFGRRQMRTVGDQVHAVMLRVGKREAGRLLDGREWNELPDTGCTP
jgi:protein gp37